MTDVPALLENQDVLGVQALAGHLDLPGLRVPLVLLESQVVLDVQALEGLLENQVALDILDPQGKMAKTGETDNKARRDRRDRRGHLAAEEQNGMGEAGEMGRTWKLGFIEAGQSVVILNWILLLNRSANIDERNALTGKAIVGNDRIVNVPKDHATTIALPPMTNRHCADIHTSGTVVAIWDLNAAILTDDITRKGSVAAEVK